MSLNLDDLLTAIADLKTTDFVKEGHVTKVKVNVVLINALIWALKDNDIHEIEI